MPRQTDFDRIERYIKGEADENEKKYVEALFLDEKENLILRNLLEKDFKAIFSDTSPSEVDLSHNLDRIHHLMRKQEILKSHKPLQRLLSVYMKVAAILLIPLLIGGGLLYHYTGDNKLARGEDQVNCSIYAPMGSRVTFNLPDGTTGMLNSGSHLIYSLPFTNNRHIKLEGEAWFEVKPDEKHPFEISAINTTVKVLGTSFNLSAYPVENYVEVVLQNGKVEFIDNFSKITETIAPSERLVFKNGNITKTVTDPEKYNAWTEGKLIFRGDPMSEVARRIERWYNVKVNIADKELEKYSFRATFMDDSIDDVIRLLVLTSPIRYEITHSRQMPDGTYNNEEITLFKKK